MSGWRPKWTYGTMTSEYILNIWRSKIKETSKLKEISWTFYVELQGVSVDLSAVVLHDHISWYMLPNGSRVLYAQTAIFVVDNNKHHRNTLSTGTNLLYELLPTPCTNKLVFKLRKNYINHWQPLNAPYKRLHSRKSWLHTNHHTSSSLPIT